MPITGLCISLFAIFCSVDSIPEKTGNLWIEKMDKQVTLKFTQSSDVEKLSVVTGRNNNIYLSPNVASVSQLSFAYRFITANVNFVPRFISGNNDDAIKGKTKSGGFGLNFNFDHWQQELSYHRTTDTCYSYRRQGRIGV